MDDLQTMRAFIAVAEAGSFTEAARRMGLSKGVVSKYVGQLEDRLGVRLLNRTTRSVAMTEIGGTYYERATQILSEIDALDAIAQAGQSEPRGRLRLTAPQIFGERFVAPLTAAFLAAHPRVSVELVLADRFVSLVEEGFDLAIRLGEPEDSSLIARKLCETPQSTVASPAYLTRAGRPQTPSELRGHTCIIDLNSRSPRLWRYRAGGEDISVSVDGPFAVNSAAAARVFALEGAGVARGPRFVVEDDIAAGTLTELFADACAGRHAAYAVYPHARRLAPKVRRYIDFAVQWMRGG